MLQEMYSAQQSRKRRADCSWDEGLNNVSPKRWFPENCGFSQQHELQNYPIQNMYPGYSQNYEYNVQQQHQQQQWQMNQTAQYQSQGYAQPNYQTNPNYGQACNPETSQYGNYCQEQTYPIVQNVSPPIKTPSPHDPNAYNTSLGAISDASSNDINCSYSGSPQGQQAHHNYSQEWMNWNQQNPQQYQQQLEVVKQEYYPVAQQQQYPQQFMAQVHHPQMNMQHVPPVPAPRVQSQPRKQNQMIVRTNKPVAPVSHNGEPRQFSESEVVAKVCGRLAMIGNLRKYNLQVEEIRRRIDAPEFITSSALACLFRKAKKKDVSANLRKMLHENYSIDVKPCQRQGLPTTSFTPLLEEEAMVFAGDIDEMTKKYYPKEMTAGLIAQSMINSRMDMATVADHLNGFLKIMQRIKDIVVPLKPKVVNHEENLSNNPILNARFTELSRRTHGFGPINQDTWIEEIFAVGTITKQRIEEYRQFHNIAHHQPPLGLSYYARQLGDYTDYDVKPECYEY